MSVTRLPKKIVGMDSELGNFISGDAPYANTGYAAARLLLQEIPGVPSFGGIFSFYGASSANEAQLNRGMNHFGSPGMGSSAGYYGSQGSHRLPAHSGASSRSAASQFNSQDWGRRFLPETGGCAYCDLGHGELCLPEYSSAWDHVAGWHAMLRIARTAMNRANRRMPATSSLKVLCNSTDGLGQSYGAHINVLISRNAYENIFRRKLQQLLYLASCFASTQVVTGAGKVGSENRRPSVDYQISQRADFMETLTGEQTTYNRPIVNSRDEALCGSSGKDESDSNGLARLHVIFFDNNLCHVSSLLKVGVTQVLLAMLEKSCMDVSLILEDPLSAVWTWSHDPDLYAQSRTITGKRLTAVEHQLALLENARRFVDAGDCEQMVPRAGEILDLWEDVLGKLEARDWAGLAPCLDWVLKRQILQRAMESGRDLSWDSPAIKHLDHLYSSLDPVEGLYWNCERSGAVKRLVTDEKIKHFMTEPPEDTRAWLRAQLLRLAPSDVIDKVDWDSIHFCFKDATQDSWPTYTTRIVRMDTPYGFTRQECEETFKAAHSFRDLVDHLAQQQDAKLH